MKKFVDNLSILFFCGLLTLFVIVRLLFLFIMAYRLDGNIIISGDSTIAAYARWIAVSTLLPCTGTKTDISVPGHTINQQLTAWNELSRETRLSADWVFVQIGLNDFNLVEPSCDAVVRLQIFIDKIKSDSPASKIICGTMTPCKQRLINIYGQTEGLVAFQKWKEINSAIVNTVSGVDKVATIHTDYLDDGEGNLAPLYNTVGDGIHENSAARCIIAYSWLLSIKNL